MTKITTMFAEHCITIFNQSINQYHIDDDVDAPYQNPFEAKTLDHLLYHKNWIDTVQWHLEDIIRDPEISPIGALAVKRRIDKSNQDRTDMVEQLDEYFYQKYSTVEKQDDARLNTETPAWTLDRLSILQLKVYHMQVEVERDDVDDVHRDKCQTKLNVLQEQERDLTKAINELMDDLESGKKIMKLYKQMKMYNEESLNPVLYKKSQA